MQDNRNQRLPDEALALIQKLDLQPHPEGGYFRETYRAAGTVKRTDTGLGAPDRAASTAIYYLLGPDDCSRWHRIQSDEIWHFYAGAPLEVYVLRADGMSETHRLGPSLLDPTCVYQAWVPALAWFAARVASASYALVGCTVAPGFEFSEFELGEPIQLIEKFPQHRDLIEKIEASLPF